MFYNYKGGAAKTTTVIHCGSTLACMGYKVLMLDCDGQCNLSSFFLPDVRPPADEEENEEEDDGDDIPVPETPRPLCSQNEPRPIIQMDCLRTCEHINLDFMRADPRTPNVLTMLEPFCTQVLPPTNFDNIHPIQVADCAEHFSCEKWNSENPTVNEKSKLFLIPGSRHIMRLERFWAKNLTTDNPDWALIGSFRHALRELQQRHNFDFILVDASPSSSLLNQTIAMNCDYIVPCCFPDFFSLSSVQGLLLNVLPSWLNQANVWRRGFKEYVKTLGGNKEQKELALKFRLPMFPRLLPFLVTNYQRRKPKGESVSKVDKQPSKYIRAMITIVDDVKVHPDDPTGPFQVTDEVKQLYIRNGGLHEEMVIPLIQTANTAMQVAHQAGLSLTGFSQKFLAHFVGWPANPWKLIEYYQERFKSFGHFLASLDSDLS